MRRIRSSSVAGLPRPSRLLVARYTLPSGRDEHVAEAAVLARKQRLLRGHASGHRPKASGDRARAPLSDAKSRLPFHCGNQVGDVDVRAGGGDRRRPRRERFDDVVRLAERALGCRRRRRIARGPSANRSCDRRRSRSPRRCRSGHARWSRARRSWDGRRGPADCDGRTNRPPSRTDYRVRAAPVSVSRSTFPASVVAVLREVAARGVAGRHVEQSVGPDRRAASRRECCSPGMFDSSTSGVPNDLPVPSQAHEPVPRARHSGDTSARRRRTAASRSPGETRSP